MLLCIVYVFSIDIVFMFVDDLLKCYFIFLLIIKIKYFN